MGDRALIQLKNKNGEFSPVIYSHWGGSTVPDMIRKTNELMSSRRGDLSYSFARMVGIFHEVTPGNLSLGAWNATALLKEEDSHGDAGCFIVDVDTGDVFHGGGYEPEGLTVRPLSEAAG